VLPADLALLLLLLLLLLPPHTSKAMSAMVPMSAATTPSKHLIRNYGREKGISSVSAYA
jgi:hypothetical protein